MAEASDAPEDVRLAQLHAGLPEDAAALAEARSDPRAAAVLDALDATRAELAAHAAPPVPAEVSARWAEALAAASPTPEPEPQEQPAAGTVRPLRRRRAPRPALIAAAALVVAVVAIGVVRSPAPQPPHLASAELVAAALQARGVGDAGELQDPANRAACLRRVLPDVDPAAPLLGGRSVVLDGRPGVLLLLPGGTLGTFRVVVVDPACTSALASVTAP